MVANLDNILDDFFASSKKNKTLIVTGERGAGKTATLKAIVDSLKKTNRIKLIAGFNAISFNSEKNEFFAKSIEEDFEEQLMQKNESENTLLKERVCQYKIFPKSFLKVTEILLKKIDDGKQYIMIDEIAHLEKRDMGWAPLIWELQKRNIAIIASIGAKHYDSVIEKFNFSKEFVIQL